MQEHWFVAFPPRARFNETRATALDLHTTASLLLDVLDIGTTLTNDLCAQIEARYRFKINRDALLRPFAL